MPQQHQTRIDDRERHQSMRAAELVEQRRLRHAGDDVAWRDVVEQDVRDDRVLRLLSDNGRSEMYPIRESFGSSSRSLT